MNFIDPLKWFLVIILILVSGYVVVRLLTKAMFKSFFEEVATFSYKKSSSRSLNKKEKKEKEND